MPLQNYDSLHTYVLKADYDERMTAGFLAHAFFQAAGRIKEVTFPA